MRESPARARYVGWMTKPSKRRMAAGRGPGSACAAIAALAALGCTTGSTSSVAHDEGPPPVAETTPPSTLAPVPNEEILDDAERSCALVGDGLKPRMVAERELGRADFGNSWVRYTFQCEPNGETPEG